jgi:hypothetical protein
MSRGVVWCCCLVLHDGQDAAAGCGGNVLGGAQQQVVPHGCQGLDTRAHTAGCWCWSDMPRILFAAVEAPIGTMDVNRY